MGTNKSFTEYLTSYAVLALKEANTNSCCKYGVQLKCLQPLTKGEKQCFDYVILQLTEQKPNNKRQISAQAVEALRYQKINISDYMKARGVSNMARAYRELAETHYKLSQAEASKGNTRFMFTEATEAERKRAEIDTLKADIYLQERKAEETEDVEKKRQLLEQAERWKQQLKEIETPPKEKETPPTVEALTGRSKKGCFEFVLTNEFTESLLKNSFITQYAVMALAIKSALVFEIITKLCVYYNQNKMHNTKHQGKISIKNLLLACPCVPCKEDLNIKGGRHYKQLIMQPMIKALQQSMNLGFIYTFSFYKGSKQLTDDEPIGNLAYAEFEKLFLSFSMSKKYPYWRLISAKHRQKEKREKREREKEARKEGKK